MQSENANDWLQALSRIARIMSTPGGGKPSLLLRVLSEYLQSPLLLFQLDGTNRRLIGNTPDCQGEPIAIVDGEDLQLCFFRPVATDKQQQAYQVVVDLLRNLRRQRHLQLTNKLLNILREVTVIEPEGMQLKEELKRITGNIAQRMDAGVVSIVMLNEQRDHFAYEVASGELALMMPDEWPISVGACGRCVRTNSVQLVQNPYQDPDYIVGNPSVQAEYLIPLRIQHEPIGVLNIEATDASLFSLENCQIFEAIAHQISGYIYLSQTMETLEQRNQELQIANAQLHRQTQVDGLTQVLNRNGLKRALSNAWERYQEQQQPLSLMMLDLDHFKRFNDDHGHLAGDAQLIGLAEIMRTVFAKHAAARYGGEEFCVVLENTDGNSALAFATEILRQVREHPELHITVSIGVAQAQSWMQNQQALLIAADKALYAAKADGRDCIREAHATPPEPTKD